MRFLKIAGVLLVILPLLVLAGGEPRPLKKLTEVDVLKLVELQIDDDAILARLGKTGVDFKVDDVALNRLKQAGASEAVLAALQGKKVEPPPVDKDLATFMVRVGRAYNWANALHSEFQINGKTIDIFHSDAEKPIGKYLQPGWNTIAIKTSVKLPDVQSGNGLLFNIGPTRVDPQTQKKIMEPVLWHFRNDTDWSLRKGKYTHALGPNVQEVTLSYRVYFAGLALEGKETQEGDFVLRGGPNYNWNSPLIATVYVNDTPLNTFLGQARGIVVTPLLKKGKNEIKVLSGRVRNAVTSNDIHVALGGAAEYNVANQRFVLPSVVQYEAATGWKHDPKTGQWYSTADPKAETIERTLPFFLEDKPRAKGK